MPATRFKNSLYRIMLPFLSPSCGTHPVSSVSGHELVRYHEFVHLLRRHHVLGSAVLLSSGQSSSLICTSSEHPWFKEVYDEISALKPGEKIDENNCSKYFSYYNITDENPGSGYRQIGESDYYYECQFSGGMPDLNLANADVRKELEKVMKFWLDKGVSGFRLDATTYYMSGDLDGNIDVLTWLNKYVKSVKEDAYIVGEAWTNEPTYSAMYKSGVDSFFNFEFADKGGVISSILNGSKEASYFGETVCKFNDDLLFSSSLCFFTVLIFFKNVSSLDSINILCNVGIL